MSAIKKEFIKQLQYLKDSRKEVIDSITKICSANPQHAQIITEALFEEFREATLERKLSLLFLMDSILKNCKEQYQVFLEEGITEAFCDTYKASINKPEVSKKLRLLFKTWEPHFSGKTIMAILNRIKKELGKDINDSLSVEELNSLIEYYRKNGIDPSHLEWQLEVALNTKKPAKKVKEEPGTLVIPPDAKAILTQKPVEKKVSRPVQVEKPTPVARPTSKTPEGGGGGTTGGGELGYKIKKKKGSVERERPPLDKEEIARTKKLKTEINARSNNPTARQGEYQNPNFGMMQHGGPAFKYGPMGGNQPNFQPDIHETTSRPMIVPHPNPNAHQGQFTDYNYHQPFDEHNTEAQFSDDENFSPGPSTTNPQSQSQFQPQFQHQFQPQGQQQLQHPQSQQRQQLQAQPHFQNLQSQSQSLQSQPQHHLRQPQHQIQPQINQFQPQPSQIQSQPQLQNQPIHHSQHHQPQLQSQFQGLGPTQSQVQPQPQLQSQSQMSQQGHGQLQYPIQSHNQGQMQPRFGQQFNPELASQQQQQQLQPINRNPQQQQQFPPQTLSKDKNLAQIRGIFLDSLGKPGKEIGVPVQELEISTQVPLSVRNDSFPEPVGLRKPSDSYEQPTILFFKILLRNLKRELPTCLKTKYQQKMGKIEPLSMMIGRRDFRIIESLYEELPYRCSSCGMRFTNRTLLNKHLDWHFQFNMELKEKTKTMNLRPQLITTEHWIRDEGNKNYKTTNIENAEDEFEFENYVPSSNGPKYCKACGENFKEVWDKNKESWLLEGAAKVKYDEEETTGEGAKSKSSNFDLMHFRCYKLCLQNETK